ncbi:MAG TPA: DUF1385 domain-containing protein [Firmicutes bacterium]|nr:DUF1385 domain-containing protein [Bacillota bacterium]
MSRSQWVGGQAVVEGVMMRHHNSLAIAFRRGDQSIGLYQEELVPFSDRYPFLRWPVLRGATVFLESLVIGVRALNISAAQVLEGEGEELTTWQTVLVVCLGLGLGLGLFFILPTLLARFLPFYSPVGMNLAEGLIRLVIFLAYLALIARWGDIERFLQYHGAEHKVIHCFEHQAQLVPSSAGGFSTRHPRCGTSFILTVMLVSIVLFSFFGWPSPVQRIIIRLGLLPLVAGLSYEVTRLTARREWLISKLLGAPGLWLQALTTREPDEGQIEVAIRALQAVLEPVSAEEPCRFKVGSDVRQTGDS